jgi:hypothetical protein
MKKMSCCLGIYVFFITADPVYAYLDPGSGSMFLQLLLGGIAGVAVILKLFWRKFTGLFGVGERDKQVSEQKESDR